MLGVVAGCALLYLFSSRTSGCLEKLTPPPAPRCSLAVGDPAAASRMAKLAAALVGAAKDPLLLRDDDGAVVVLLDAALVLLPASEQRPPSEALAAALATLPVQTRDALRDRTAVVVRLGRGQGDRAATTARESWAPSLRLELVHDDLTDEGCLVRADAPPHPGHRLSNRDRNEIEKNAARAETALVDAFGQLHVAPLTASEAAARVDRAARLLHSAGVWAERVTATPLAALVLLGVLLLFHWRVAADGDGDGNVLTCETTALLKNGALDLPTSPGDGPRLVAYGLLHVDLKHLLNNAVSLWLGAYLLEPALGAARSTLVFLAGVLAAGVARRAIGRPGILVGASGGVFALQGAALGLALRTGPWVPVLERQGFLVLLGVMLVLGLLLSFMPHVSLIGHAAGAVTGALLALSGLITLGRPTLDGGAETALASYVSWALAAAATVAWVATGLWSRHRSTPRPGAAD